MKIFSLSTLFILLLSGKLWAFQLEGEVRDQHTKEPLIGAIIAIEGTTIGDLTDEKGHFSLILEEKWIGSNLTVSYVGYQKQDIQIGEQNFITIELIPNKFLEEVVIQSSIAGTKPKEQIATSYNQINAEELAEEQSFNNMADVLNGRSGAMQTFGVNGKVGSGIRFNTRASATFSLNRDPLVFVDGVRMNTSNINDVGSSAQETLAGLNDLNLNNIASIEVLKGPAAAASYGSEASNGVILIRTKKGTGERLNINLKTSQGLNVLANKYNFLVNNKDINDFYTPGRIQNIYGSVSGRSGENGLFLLSIDHRDNESHVPGNRDLRETFNGRYDYNKKKYSFGFSSQYTVGQLWLPPTGSGKYDATWNLMKDQKPWPFLEGKREAWAAQEIKYDNNRFLGNLYLNYSPIENLEIRSTLGYDQNTVDGINYKPFGINFGSIQEGAKTSSNRINSNTNWEISANYLFELNPKNRLRAALASQLNYSQSIATSVSVEGFPSENVNGLGAAGTITSTEESRFEKRTQGVYGELSYDYDNKLFLTTGLRRDASNLLGSNVSSIWYPQANLVYNLTEEKLFQNIFDQLKLRMAYGESGRLPHPEDAKTTYKAMQMPTGPGYITYIKGNPDIRPERSKEWELGTDLGYKWIDINFTYYRQKTVDAIVYTDLKPSEGWSTNSAKYAQNAGSINGSGYELGFNINPFKDLNHKLTFEIFGNINYQENKVTDTGGQEYLYFASAIKEGLPAYAFYTQKSQGAVFNEDGTYAGEIIGDYENLGKPFPDYSGSFGLNMTIARNLSINSLFTFATGFQIYNISQRNIAGQGDNLLAKETALEKMNQSTVGSDEYKYWANELSQYERSRGNFVQDGDFLRLSNVVISYNLTKTINNWFGHLSFSHVVLSASGSNLWLTTKYKGVDPLVAGEGGSRDLRNVSHIGSDWTSVPAPRTYLLTLNIGI
ncbi:TonB-dependent receptor domain-containing protein [Xanthovirga aplysinae]|uniref:TonB-dependent receptor domain-containing protein n=1 Tax=Xanthovirga aplysinae TaxID=2529853 RepID=UPI0016573F86|nr:TonB-dependent receptor [Xanthovirga aplysinae]